MNLDLFKVYKMYIQRCRRNPADLRLRGIKEDMEYLIKQKLTKSEMLDLAKRIKAAENELQVRKNYAVDVLRAIEKGTYTIDVPYPVLHKWREKKESEGYLYLAVSAKKPGQVKIGATTMPIWKLEEIYSSRWGYAISVVWKTWVNEPFGAKDRLKATLRPKLVSGLTSGESNEWYYGEPEAMVTDVFSIIGRGT